MYKIKGGSMNFFKSFIIILSIICFTVNAKYHVITNERKYNDFINKYPYTVLCFVDSTPDEGFVDRSAKKDHRKAIGLFKQALKSASLSGDYKKLLKNEVGFLLVDVSKRSAEDLDNEFLFSELPSCVLLKNGEPVDEFDQPVKIAGFSTKANILDFIDDHVADELDDLKEQKEEEAEQDRVERIARLNAMSRHYGWNPYGGFGPYYYGMYGMHPYYSPYGYRRAHFGVGIVL